MNFRKATIQDLVHIQKCNLLNLPENYVMKYYYYHLLTWPDISFVAECIGSGKIVGYVLCKLEDEEDPSNVHGHVTSLSVLRPYRQLGIAEELMKLAEKALSVTYAIDYVSLHVRIGNEAAVKLYRDCLGFSIHSVDKSYYADGEDAYAMKKTLQISRNLV